MATKWYGSLVNRLEENHDAVPEIRVGTGMTRYSWSDRDAYEVIAVKDQKHVTVRQLGHRPAGEPMSNQWELYSDENAPTYDLVKRGKYWYTTYTITRERLERLLETCPEAEVRIECVLARLDFDVIMEKGKQTRYNKWDVSFGRASYYYDYSF